MASIRGSIGRKRRLVFPAPRRPAALRGAACWLCAAVWLIVLAGGGRIASAVTAGLVRDIHPSGSSTPQELTSRGEDLFFSAQDGAHGRELWTSDGTTTGTVLVKDIRRNGSSTPSGLTELGAEVFFSARDNASGVELWKSDGTTTYTVRVHDINAGTKSSYPSELTPAGGALFFAATDGVHGTELWKSEGAFDSAVLVKDIWPESNYSSFPRYLTNVKETLLFSANDPESGGGRELWKSDGTEPGTVLVKDINPLGPSEPIELAAPGEVLFFSAYDDANGRELWRSDGTTSHTLLVKDIWDGMGSSFPAHLTGLTTGTLFFSAADPDHGTELWKTDGTPEGTRLVKDINSGGDSNPDHLAAAGGKMFFAADDGVHGIELWKSDGTTEGTVLVKDINTTDSANPEYLTNAGGVLFFAATDGVHGAELWMSDGTEAGTRMAADVFPGASSGLQTGPVSGGDPIALCNGSVFFSADDGTAGRELWVVRKGGPPTLVGPVQDLGGGVAGLGWTNPLDPPEEFLGLAWDIYGDGWAEVGGAGSPWRPYGALASSGAMELEFSGGYHLWISSLYWDGWYPCLNPWTGIEYSGTPHMLTDVGAESLGGGQVRLHWKPEVYGTWLLEIIAYKIGEGFVAVEGPSSGFGYDPWTFIDYGGGAYDPQKADFFGGWADFTVPSEGNYWFFVGAVGWLPPYANGEFATPFVSVGP